MALAIAVRGSRFGSPGLSSDTLKAFSAWVRWSSRHPSLGVHDPSDGWREVAALADELVGELFVGGQLFDGRASVVPAGGGDLLLDHCSLVSVVSVPPHSTSPHRRPCPIDVCAGIRVARVTGIDTQTWWSSGSPEHRNPHANVAGRCAWPASTSAGWGRRRESTAPYAATATGTAQAIATAAPGAHPVSSQCPPVMPIA